MEGHGGAPPLVPPAGYYVDEALAPEMPEVLRQGMDAPATVHDTAPPEQRTTRSAAALDPRCSVCQRKQYETPGGVVCSEGHGGASPAAPPEGVALNPAPRHPDYAKMLAEFEGAVAVCLHGETKQGPVGTECLLCGARALRGLDGHLLDWGVPPEAAAEAPPEGAPDPEVAAAAFAAANPDVLATMRGLYSRVGNRDLFVELMASVVGGETV